jgi:chitodextrinase
LSAPRWACLLAVLPLACYAPGHWRECRVQCSPTGGCPAGSSCAGDGYCHRGAGSCASGGNQSTLSFLGAHHATGAVNAIVLDWSAASADHAPAEQIDYLVYQSRSPGGEDFTRPAAITSPGATLFAVPGLAPSTRYYFVVRARDPAGDVDGNDVEVNATTLAGSDTTPPVFAGLGSAQAAAPYAVELSWAPASDDVTSNASIVYFVYMSTHAGGEDLHAPLATTAPGATSFHVGGLTAGTTYYFVVRARDQAGNIDGNTVERAATVLADHTPPLFAGAKSATATALVLASITLAWSPASDDVTPSKDIVYDVYSAGAAGKESFAHPTLTSPPGATSVDIGGLLPATTYFFVVRARDQAGNEDGNTVEVWATTPVL